MTLCRWPLRVNGFGLAESVPRRDLFPMVPRKHDGPIATGLWLNPKWRPLVIGLLHPLTEVENWEGTDAEKEQAAQWARDLLADMYT